MRFGVWLKSETAAAKDGSGEAGCAGASVRITALTGSNAGSLMRDNWALSVETASQPEAGTRYTCRSADRFSNTLIDSSSENTSRKRSGKAFSSFFADTKYL